MKIMIVGICDVAHSTNTFMAKAFESLGHIVYRYNYITLLKNGITNGTLEDHFINTIKTNKQDLIIFCKTDKLSVSAHKRASEITKTHYWFMDPITTATLIGASERAKACNTASATANEVVDLFLEHGQYNSFKMSEGVDISLYRPEEYYKNIDVLFVGSATQQRAMYINYIRNYGIKVKIHGEGWGSTHEVNPPIYNNELVATIARSKIVLNISRTNSYSDRVILTMATGSFLLSSYTKELESDFKISRHLEVFKTHTDLLDEILFYIKNTNDREYIANAGCSFVRENYTWKKKCKNLIEVINGIN